MYTVWAQSKFLSWISCMCMCVSTLCTEYYTILYTSEWTFILWYLHVCEMNTLEWPNSRSMFLWHWANLWMAASTTFVWHHVSLKLILKSVTDRSQDASGCGWAYNWTHILHDAWHFNFDHIYFDLLTLCHGWICDVTSWSPSCQESSRDLSPSQQLDWKLQQLRHPF